MASLRVTLPFTFGVLGLVAIPAASFGGLHFADAPFDATDHTPTPAVPASLDSSPSIAAGPDETWLAWARTSTDSNPTQSAIVVVRVDPATGPQSGPPSLLLPADLADVALAHDGSRFLAAYSRSTDAVPTGADLYLWPIAAGTDPTTNLLMAQVPGRSLDLSVAPLVRNDGIPFVLGYYDPAHGLVVAAGSFATNATYTSGITLHPTADTTHFDGRAARVGLDSLLALTSDSHGVLVRDQNATWGTVPSAIHAIADLVVRPADVVVAAAAGLNRVHLSAIDRAPPHAITPAWPADFPTTGTLGEIALAPDLRGGEWLVTLSHDVRLGELLDVSTHAGSESVTLANPGFAICQRLHAAPFAADHDALAISAQCSESSTSLSHVIVWIVHRDPPAMPDAGADAAVDASVDVVSDVVEDATVDSDTSDAVIIPAFDASASGTGPSFRGSGCSCTTAPTPSSPLKLGLAAMSVAFSLAAARWRRNRRALARNA